MRSTMVVMTTLFLANIASGQNSLMLAQRQAVLQAMQGAFRPDAELPFVTPMTPERALMSTHQGVAPGAAGAPWQKVEPVLAYGGSD